MSYRGAYNPATNLPDLTQPLALIPPIANGEYLVVSAAGTLVAGIAGAGGQTVNRSDHLIWTDNKFFVIPIDDIRVGVLGVTVNNSANWTTTGSTANRNALDANITERVINRLLNSMNSQITSSVEATDGFVGRFNNVIGNEGSTDQAAFDGLGKNLIQAVADLSGGGPGNGASQAAIDEAVDEHNKSATAHPDVRTLISNLVLSQGSGAAVWGQVTGTITDQADLKNALDAKQDTGAGDGASQQAIDDAIEAHDESPISHADIRTAINNINAGAGGLPSGGIAGQQLRKKTNAPFDTEWGWGAAIPATDRFTTPGTFSYQVTDSGLYLLMVAGAGGGGAERGHHASGGGGAVAWLAKSLQAGDVLQIVIGKGGAHVGSAGGTGEAGGDSSIGMGGTAYLTAGGGQGAFAGMGTGNFTVGAGGTFSGEGVTGINGNPGLEGGAEYSPGGAAVSISREAYLRTETVTSGPGTSSNPTSPPGGDGEALIAFMRGVAIPRGGETGDVLTKRSDDDFDVEWEPFMDPDPAITEIITEYSDIAPFSQVGVYGTGWTMVGSDWNVVFTRAAGGSSSANAYYQVPGAGFDVGEHEFQFQAAAVGGNFHVAFNRSTSKEDQRFLTITPTDTGPRTVIAAPDRGAYYPYIVVSGSATGVSGTFRLLAMPRRISRRLEGQNAKLLSFQDWDIRAKGTNLWIGGGGINAPPDAENNLAIGRGALAITGRNVIGTSNNIAFGSDTLRGLTTGDTNIAIGNDALRAATTGSNNVAIGFEALLRSTSGANAVAIGYQALHRRTTGTFNIGIGYQAGAQNTTGAGVVAIGYRALSPAVPTGSGHAGTIAIGYQPLTALTSGTYNCAIGYNALHALTTGGYNTAIGTNAGSYAGDPATGTGGNSLCTNSVFIGYYACAGALATPAVDQTNVISIGYNAPGGGSNTITLGNSAITALRCQRTTISALSDVRVKEDIHAADLDRCVATVRQLPVSRWAWTDKAGTHLDRHVTGWTADDVEKVWPKAVTRHGYRDLPDAKYVTAEDALPTLWGAVQKLIEKNEQLECELEAIRKERSNGSH